MVQQMIDSKFSEYGLTNTETGLPNHDKQLLVPVVAKKKALRDLQNENTILVPPKSAVITLFPKESGPTSDAGKISGTKRPTPECLMSPSHQKCPTSNTSNGHLVYVRRKAEAELGKSSASDITSNNVDYSQLRKLGDQDKATGQKLGMKDSKMCVPEVASLTRASLIPNISMLVVPNLRQCFDHFPRLNLANMLLNWNRDRFSSHWRKRGNEFKSWMPWGNIRRILEESQPNKISQRSERKHWTEDGGLVSFILLDQSNLLYCNITELQLCSSQDNREIFPSFEPQGPAGIFRLQKYHQKPRKKRTKLTRIDNSVGVSSSGVTKPRKYGKKPDPSAPKITRPCSECGRKFWSWKALFGHMRCHPERQWRGINPPPNFSRPLLLDNNVNDLEARMSDDDREVATCLLMLANGPSAYKTPAVTPTSTANLCLSECETVVRDLVVAGGDVNGAGPSYLNCRFECSSCKKVFGSHQALGGHRASHKNVKGCFAITRNDGEDDDRIGDYRNGEGEVKDNGEDKMLMVVGHRCSICLRVFSSGQALGGHKRCHWEKVDEPSELSQGLTPFITNEGCGLDLNLPAPVEDDSSLSYSSGCSLDLRLGSDIIFVLLKLDLESVDDGSQIGSHKFPVNLLR
ncbi:unnamed protein product [Ilex paraguariensis]|uniref:C2H2-type domain-containing protein n=1 Tax=Ilex paraguariensis TaxID=185542 RepID=A0ABC8S9Q9_9AQUA